MRRLALIALLAAGCTKPPNPGPVQPGAATCEQACAHLDDLGCGFSACMSVCSPLGQSYAACVAAAGDCSQSDACDAGH